MSESVHPFRFGVQPRPVGTVTEWRTLARKIEALGYSSLLLPDHVAGNWAPVPALAAAVEATTSIKLGTLVLNGDLRNPVLLAKEAATLDVLSSGRLELGIGAGWSDDDYAAVGLTRDPALVRVERLREMLVIMKRLWRDGSASHSGRHFHIECSRCEPRPLSRPWPTICVGGGGRPILEMAAQEADIVSINPDLGSGVVGRPAVRTASPTWYAKRVGWIRAAAGSRFASLELHCMTFWGVIGRSARELLTRLSARFGIDEVELLTMPIITAGSVSEVVETLLERRERYGISYISFYDADAFAPIVERLAGR